MSIDVNVLQQDIYVITYDNEVVVTTNINDIGSLYVPGTMIYISQWDASGGVLPTPAPSKGHVFRISSGGQVPYLGGTVSLETGTMIMALIDSPGQNMVNYTTL